MSEEAQTRKDRSERILRAANIPIHPWLPCCAVEANYHGRQPVEIARRAIGLAMFAGLRDMDTAEVLDLARRFKLIEFFTPRETRMLIKQSLTDGELLQCSWLVEAAWVLLWAIGLTEPLALPVAEIDPRQAIKIVSRGVEGLTAKAEMRSAQELLDMADLVMRCNWALREDRREGRENGSCLNPDTTMERHHAINWLVFGDDWDDVQTDT